MSSDLVARPARDLTHARAGGGASPAAATLRGFATGAKRSGEETTGVAAFGTAAIVLRRAGGDQPAAAVAGLGAELQHVVGTGDHVEVVFDHHHRVAALEQPRRAPRAASARRRRAVPWSARRARRSGVLARPARQLRAQLDALRFAAAETCWPAGRASGSRGRRRRAAAAAARCVCGCRRTAVRRRPASRGPARCSCRGTRPPSVSAL